ncbi:DUF6994 family protein [Marihabitans asiaticum]|uniref:Uncharacterized protein n=1 Tax=Marihabitans asiaticum TaxID=415218 RepID=A0A560WHW5_9MICO|nr:hypothetical protein [Marihabitans asiaticum]TWD17094.1 hypothetical protein FB557_0652 [Marihabitans asiaticum]
MDAAPWLDVEHDFFADTPKGKDPDHRSDSLRRFHQLLWSKPLRSGRAIRLTLPSRRNEGYLIHQDGETRLWFGSDAITHSYGSWLRPAPLVQAVSGLTDEQRSRYLGQPYTIAQTMIWPVRASDRPTINQARGTRSAIADRIDLTLECIRRHYDCSGESPLTDVLTAYGDFFAMFQGFDEFIDFFHLQDLVSDDYARVRYFLPNNDFQRHGSPQTTQEYVDYREAQLDFVDRRSRRIDQWLAEHI